MKKTIFAAIMTLICVAAFSQNAESDFEFDGKGTITKYKGWEPTVVIPATINGKQVTAIGGRAFEKNDLTSVTIPRGVTSIGGSAFSTNKLTRVTIPDSVTSIGGSAFASNQLTSVIIPGNNVIIGQEAFANNPITSITLGKNHVFNASIVPKVNVNRTDRDSSLLFYDYVCNDRKAGTYTANRAIGSVKKEADFEYYETQYGAYITGYTGNSGNRLEIPSRLGGLSVKALSGLKNISRVRIPDSVTYIGYGAFNDSKLTEITIPNSVTYIGDGAFYRNQLTSITIPDSVTYIGYQAFYQNKLTSVTIGNSVTHIGNEAFSGGYYVSSNTNQLTSVTIPNSVTHIGKDAFSDDLISAYYNNGKAAGTYVLSGNNWATREMAERQEQERYERQQQQEQQRQERLAQQEQQRQQQAEQREQQRQQQEQQRQEQLAQQEQQRQERQQRQEQERLEQQERQRQERLEQQEQEAKQTKIIELSVEMDLIQISIIGNSSLNRSEFSKVVQYYELLQQLEEVFKGVKDNVFYLQPYLTQHRTHFNDLVRKFSRSQRNDFLKRFPGSIQ